MTRAQARTIQSELMTRIRSLLYRLSLFHQKNESEDSFEGAERQSHRSAPRCVGQAQRKEDWGWKRGVWTVLAWELVLGVCVKREEGWCRCLLVVYYAAQGQK